LRSVRIRAAALEREGLLKEVPYRIFNKLDETLFAGHLKNAVFLDVENLGSDVSGATYTHGWGPKTEGKRVSIILNNDVLGYARSREIVAILIHHMIHAYFLVACGPQKEEEVEYGRLAHGVHFGKIMMVVKKLSAAHGKELTPLSFGHDLGEFRHFDYYPRKKKPMERKDKDKWYCSHCHPDVEELSESDIDKWYGRVCKPLFDWPKIVRSAQVEIYNDRRHELEKKPRSRTTPSAKSVEFLFKDKPILVDSRKIDDLLSIGKAFLKAKSRFLEIHEKVSEKTFLRFLEFLHTGSYRPDPPALTMGMGLSTSKKGPPIIKSGGTNTLPTLLADIQFANLGTNMCFAECKTYALSRMNAYGATYEDPVALLSEIYHSGEPDPDLKAWARKFLVHAPSSSPDYLSPGLHRNTAAAEPPNLVKLESEQWPFRARFLDAVESSGALENDVRKAWVEIAGKGW
ncbi:hypothetical protein P153DRAFT_259885, partial [Dothidotthia symphoricarpi CBS 119687]